MSAAALAAAAALSIAAAAPPAAGAPPAAAAPAPGTPRAAAPPAAGAPPVAGTPSGAAPRPATAWRLPVAGRVLRGFAYDERRPFAAGQRRGVDLATRGGAVVRSACSGRVSHAGRVPRRGLGVSVRCGRLTATHLGLGRLAVRRDAAVRRGARLGRAGPRGVVRLGARVTARRFGWVDPLALLAAPSRPPPAAGPAPVARERRGPPPLAAPRPLPAGRPAPAPRDVPALAWLGAALLGAGLPLGAVVTVTRVQRRRGGAPAVATRAQPPGGR